MPRERLDHGVVRFDRRISPPHRRRPSRGRLSLCLIEVRQWRDGLITPGRRRRTTTGNCCRKLPKFKFYYDIGLVGLSEPETVRHYVRLSQKNHAIDLALYPLGSCTMKHNPRLNEKLARLPGFADLHPLARPRPSRAPWP